MANWRELLKEAKELFDDGLINESDYEQLKQEALALRRKSGRPTQPAPRKANDSLQEKTWPLEMEEEQSSPILKQLWDAADCPHS